MIHLVFDSVTSPVYDGIQTNTNTHTHAYKTISVTDTDVRHTYSHSAKIYIFYMFLNSHQPFMLFLFSQRFRFSIIYSRIVYFFISLAIRLLCKCETEVQRTAIEHARTQRPEHSKEKMCAEVIVYDAFGMLNLSQGVCIRGNLWKEKRR